MSKRFGDGACRLAGLAGRMLGWPPHWFWRATPGELAAILFDDSHGADAGMTRGRMLQMMKDDYDG